MKIEIWSDYACPFCYIGEKKLNKALIDLDLINNAEITYKSFQLNPNATSQNNKDINKLIADKYGIPYEQAKAANDNIINTAKQVGLDFDFGNLKPGNTRQAHELYKYSETLGKNKELTEALFQAYFENGVDISDKKELINIANRIGINKESVKEVFDNKTYTNSVLEDQELAYSKNINSVPFFVINEKHTVSGAQSIEYFKDILGEATK